MNTTRILIQLYRSLTGLTNSELAARFDVTPPTISHWCRGKTVVPGDVILRILAERPELFNLVRGGGSVIDNIGE